MTLNHELRYGSVQHPFHLEYNRRKGHFSMATDHMHRHYELYYLFGGERYFFIKDRIYPVRSGDMVFVPSNEVHKTLDTGVPNHERIVLYFNMEYFDQMVDNEAELLLTPFHHGNRVIHLAEPEKLRIEHLLYDMLREIQDQSPGYEQPLTLGSLSERFYLSPSHLSRTFKKNTGFGLIEYIGITRTKEAQRLLRETDERITVISERSGFENFSHFEKVFKSFTRMSPRSYRSGFHQKET
ncbi:AraC family transcriptional regulator [Paenibacillus dokdonensis]|uniref:AraC family transcriptional regulator n=1 Tax=Paenibacillus dokdonensis TaxID=2567944 RepID=A0ABU6GK94_9BACL|nr:AraC family transcriptional regulator [Paenibacillus dokdonensis]MEC0240154.1 AraC family transcriptional regulator [Paenibacillus dokdonensis]